MAIFDCSRSPVAGYSRLSSERPASRGPGCYRRGYPGLRLRTFPRIRTPPHIGAFLLLGMQAIWRKVRLAAGIAACLGFFFAGILIDPVRVPGPPPELDAGGCEIVILGGGVVEPRPSQGKATFHPRARAPRPRPGHPLYAAQRTASRTSLMASPSSSTRACANRATLATPVLSIMHVSLPAGHFLDSLRRSPYFASSAGTVWLVFAEGRHGLRQAALIGRLYHGGLYQTG